MKIEKKHHKYAAVVLVCIVSAMSFSLLAATPAQLDSVMQDAKSFGVQQNSTITNSASTMDPTTIPGYQANPPQTQYYGGSSNDLETLGLQESLTNQTAIDIRNSVNTRPPMVIDTTTDPIFMRYNQIRDLSHSLTDNGYQGCVDLPVGTEDVTSISNTTCNATRSITEETCSNTLTVTANVVGQCVNGTQLSTATFTYDSPWNSVDANFKLDLMCMQSPSTAGLHLWNLTGGQNTDLGMVDVLNVTNATSYNDVWSTSRTYSFNVSFATLTIVETMYVSIKSVSCDTAQCIFTMGIRAVYGGSCSRNCTRYLSDVSVNHPLPSLQSTTDTWNDTCQVIRERP